MKTPTNSALAAIGLAASALIAAGSASAQGTYPNQPVRIVVPNPPGGLPDVLSRIVADKLKDKLGQSVVVENRPGANAGIGAAVVTASKPDGYTLLMSDSAIITISHHHNAELPFNAKDLMPVTLVGRAPIFLGASAKLPAASLKELAEYVKANPGKISYGSSGVGSFHHLSMEALQTGLGLKLNHIPYKGSGESVTALRGGHIDLVFAAYAGLSPAVKANQARFIAVNSLKRSEQAPEVPAIAETIPGFDLAVTQSLFARTGTPVEIVDRIAAEVAVIVKDPDVIQKFATAGIEPVAAGPKELAKVLQGEAERVITIVKAAGLKPN